MFEFWFLCPCLTRREKMPILVFNEDIKFFLYCTMPQRMLHNSDVWWWFFNRSLSNRIYHRIISTLFRCCFSCRILYFKYVPYRWPATSVGVMIGSMGMSLSKSITRLLLLLHLILWVHIVPWWRARRKWGSWRRCLECRAWKIVARVVIDLLLLRAIAEGGIHADT